VVSYSSDVGDVTAEQLGAFFVGWPSPPSPEQHLAVLRGSYRAVVAREDDRQVVGFVTMISDGVLTAFVPWLEVLPGHQGRGIGTELVRRVLEGTEHLYSVDLLCDEPLQAFYRRLGFVPVPGMGLRNPAAIAAGAPRAT
jgi:ribosomal protein S18 acetylase RimI-like enzyme